MPEDSNPPFASAALMEARSLGAITTASHPFLEDELRAATRAIREFCRWHVAPARPVTYRRAGRLADDVWLSAMEVASINAVTIDGREWSADEVAAVEFDSLTGWTNLRGRRVAVTYTAGFETVPEDVVALTLELAASALGTSLGQTREQAGSVSVTYDRTGGGIAEGSLAAARLIPYRIGRLA